MLKAPNSKVKGLYVRGRTYYARLTVPKHLKRVLGNEFVKSLETSDLKIAEARATALLQGWRIEIDNALGVISPDQEALAWKAELSNTKPPTRNGKDSFDYDSRHDAYSTYLDNVERTKGYSEAVRINQMVTGKRIPTAEFIPLFLATRTVTPKSLQQEETRLKLMADKFPTLPVKQREVNQWWLELTQEHVTKKGKPYSPETAGFIMNKCGIFYRFLIDQGHLHEDLTNPFKEVSRYDGGGKKNKRSTNYLPWSPEDVYRLVTAAQEKRDSTLLQFILIGAHTGARADEIAKLKVNDVHISKEVSYFSITDAKTKAGLRDVPIHPYIEPLFRELITSSYNEFILPSLTTTSLGVRAHSIGQKFGRLKKGLGFDERHVFHSFRSTVTNLALSTDNKCLNVVQDIIGHEKGNITEDIYNAPGSSLQQRLDLLVSALRYPFHSTPVLKLVRPEK